MKAFKFAVQCPRCAPVADLQLSDGEWVTFAWCSEGKNVAGAAVYSKKYTEGTVGFAGVMHLLVNAEVPM